MGILVHCVACVFLTRFERDLLSSCRLPLRWRGLVEKGRDNLVSKEISDLNLIPNMQIDL